MFSNRERRVDQVIFTQMLIRSTIWLFNQTLKVATTFGCMVVQPKVEPQDRALRCVPGADTELGKISST